MENKQNWMLMIIGGLLSYVIVEVITDRRNEKLAEKQRNSMLVKQVQVNNEYMKQKFGIRKEETVNE